MRAANIEHEQLKVSLRLKGSSLSKVAKELGVSATAVTYTSTGRSKSKRIENHIAQRLGLELYEIWPSRYQRK